MKIRLTAMRIVAGIGLCTFAALPAYASGAAGHATGNAGPTWIHPAIKGYGGVHPRPDLPLHPEPGKDYKVIVDVISGSKDPSKVPHSLQRLARLVNLMAYAKVPADHVHIVAVFDGKVGFATARNSVYREHFHTDNPNLKLLHALHEHGVTLLDCSQALAGMKLPDSAVSPDVELSLSALTDFVIYGQRGYSYMQL